MKGIWGIKKMFQIKLSSLGVQTNILLHGFLHACEHMWVALFYVLVNSATTLEWIILVACQ